MKITGFSFVKNAVVYGYPVVEAIKSILPICDEFVIAVGKCDDGTLELIRSVDKEKIRIIETDWDESLRAGGRVLAEETNKAFKEVSKDSDWAFYIQGDEVIHEKYLSVIKNAMLKYKDDYRIDGLLFKYLHFYGSFDYVGVSSNWYKNEIRVIRNDKNIYSYKDAQGFRKGDNEKLVVKPIDAYVYHYGWVRDPRTMQQKQSNFRTLYHSDEKLKEIEPIPVDGFSYEKHVRELTLFTESHPEVMKKRIQEQNWKFDYDISKDYKSLKDKTKAFLKKYLGIDSDYKNYKLAKFKDIKPSAKKSNL